jgi:hypothetical protein
VSEDEMERLAQMANLSIYTGLSIACALRDRGLLSLGEVAAWADEVASRLPSQAEDAMAVAMRQFGVELRKLDTSPPVVMN